MKKITYLLALIVTSFGFAQDGLTCGTAFTTSPGSFTGVTIDAVNGVSELGTGANAVWYAYTPAEDGTIDVSACLGGVDTALHVSTGTCGALTEVAENDDSCPITVGGSSFASEVTGVPVTGGTTYYIEWDNEWSEGPFDWSFSFTPAPECTPAVLDTLQALTDCDNAQYSILVPFVSEGDATGVSDGTTTFPIVDGAATAGPYASGDTVTLDVVHSDVACNIALGDLFFNCPENQDTCATADAVTPGTYTTTINAGSGGAEMGTGDDSAFFAYTASGDGTLYVNSCEGGADTFLNIGTGTCGALVVSGSNDDSCASGLGNNFASEVTIPVTAGTTYYIEWDNRYATGANEFVWTLEFTPAPLCTEAVIDSSTIVAACDPDGTGTFTIDHIVSNAGDENTVLDDGTNMYAIVDGTVTTGPYNSGDSITIEVTAVDVACSYTLGTFDFTCPPPAPDNDDCANATPIACDETINATSEGSMGTQEGSGCSMGDNGIWYTFTGTGGDMTVSVDASFDHEVAITSGSCGALVNVNCDDQSVGTEAHTFASVLDETYYVYVAHFSSGNTTTGTIDITLTCAVIPECTQAVIDSSAIVETCNPDGTGTFTVEHIVSNAGDAGTVLNDGTNTYPVTVGTVITGPYNSGDSVTIELTGTDPVCDFTVGTFDFTCPPPAPDNDDIAGAINLPVGSTVCETIVAGTNVGATDSIENDTEASCSSSDPAGDVWFKVVVPSSGDLTIEVSASVNAPIITDTVMEVYTGTSGALVEIACSDDIGGGNLLSSVALTGLNPGDVLLVRIWEWQDNFKGNFNICAWSPTTLSLDDNTFNGFTYYPNPVKNVLTLESPNTIDTIEVFNILGQRIVAIDSQNTIQNIDLSNIQAGAYFVKVSIGNQIKTLRIIKE